MRRQRAARGLRQPDRQARLGLCPGENRTQERFQGFLSVGLLNANTKEFRQSKWENLAHSYEKQSLEASLAGCMDPQQQIFN